MTLPGADPITSLLSTFLDVQSRRAEVVSSNIANAETPGYRAKELDFQDYLRQAASEALSPRAGQYGSPKGLSLSETLRLREQDAPEMIGLDGNTVDTGREMSSLAETGMQFVAGTQLLQTRLRTLRAAIREGR
ncbi:MAG: flagellar basal body rod protein FlgB [Pyrinomonadaceae bacterium]|nr:flagellar basal body rod protein FlgB [Pyrinomonadaceae bacterium]